MGDEEDLILPTAVSHGWPGHECSLSCDASREEIVHRVTSGLRSAGYGALLDQCSVDGCDRLSRRANDGAADKDADLCGVHYDAEVRLGRAL